MRERDAIGGGAARPEGVHPYRNLLTAKAVENHFKRQARPIVLGVDVIPTPWESWNWACLDGGGQLGLARDWHIILAGNTGAGKSIFSLNIAASAIRAGVTVGFANLEMSAEQLQARLLGILTGEAVAAMQRGKLFDPSVADRVTARLHEVVGDARLLVNDDELADEPLNRLDDIVRLTEHWATEQDAGLIIVDYMQLAGTGRADEVAERVTQISRAIRAVARSKNVVTIGLSQFNRGTSGNYKESPRVQGLFGASGLENDAHQVALIDHSRYEKVEGGARAWLLLAKNRHGPEIEIPVWFSHRTLVVAEARPDEEHLWPGAKKGAA